MNLRRSVFVTGVVALIFLGCAQAWAQETPVPAAGEQSPQAIRTLYQDYERARFAVRFTATPAAVMALQPRMNRFWYLLLHARQQELGAAQPQLRFGFFKSREEAEQFVVQYGGILPGLSVVPVERRDFESLMATQQAGGDTSWYWLSPKDSVSQTSLQTLLERAKNFYIDGDYQQAVNHYSALSLAADSSTSLWARELLGLSYERQGENLRATTIYQQLLDDAPESSGASRVAQRLRAVRTASSDGQEALRKSDFASNQKKPLLRGVIGQSYRFLTRGGRQIPDEDVLSVVATHLDIHASKEVGAHAFQARLNGYHLYDDMDVDRYTKSYLKRMYLDYTHTTSGLNLTAGRQRDFRTGVFTAFDGVSLRYPVLEKLTLGVNLGEPVLFADVYDDLDRQFFSVQADYAFNEAWNFTGYYTEQTLFEETDRKAYGGELRYTTDSTAAYASVDYDYEFAEFNNALLGVTYRFDDASTLSGSYGRQRSPFLTSTNILMGQPFLDLEVYLQDQWNRDNLLYRALQRTSLSEFATANYSRKLDDNLDITLDFYQSVMSEMPVFTFGEDVETDVVSTDAEYRYTAGGVQLVASDFLGFDDVATLSLRTSDSTQSSSNWVQLSERLRFFNGKFFITPKLHLGYTQSKANQHTQSRIRGSLAAKYKPFRNTELFVEVGNEVYNDLELRNRLESQYLHAGYMARF